MKCPKCGYNSFEFLDLCKKCGNDLIVFKESKGIRSVLIPVVEKVQENSAAAISSPVGQADGNFHADDEPFKWEEPATNSPFPTEETAGEAEFSFGEAAPVEETSLDGLLESSTTLERSTIEAGGDGTKAPAKSFTGGFDSAPGEFELEDLFSAAPQEKKEDNPVPKQAKPAQESLDGDFDFLFSNDEEEKK